MTDAMRDALERSVIAIDDWLQTYAAELCDPARVEEASKRIGEYGTLSYIAIVQEQNRAALALEPQPKYFTGCLRDGVCRGVCRNTDCPNYDLVVAARLVVEKQVEGIVYPSEPVWDDTSSDLEPIKGKS